MKLKTLVILLLSLFILGCRADFSIAKKSRNTNFQREEVNFTQFKKETKLTSLEQGSYDKKVRQRIAKGHQTKNLRHFLDEFYIDTLYIKKTTLGDKDTYTFNAIKLFDVEDKKYNIVYYKYRGKWEYNIFEVDGKKIIKPIFNSIVGHLIDSDNEKIELLAD